MDTEETRLPAILRIFSVAFLVLLIAMPLVQKSTRLFPEAKLGGVEARPRRQKLTMEAWFNGTYAKQFEKRFSCKVGFRGLCVKLVNQLNFSVFGKTTVRSGTRITQGMEGWLYETAYIEHCLDPPIIKERDRKAFVGDLKELQDLLHDRGAVFILVISPSKVRVVPEHLPAGLGLDASAIHETGAYDSLIDELRDAGVRVEYVHEFFESIRERTPCLFTRGGTHWSYYSCFLFCQHLLRSVQPDLPGKIVVPEIERVVHDNARGTDNDLADLLNLIWFGPLNDEMPYPEARTDALPIGKRARVLVVGDSFAFTMVDSLNRAKAAGKMDLLFYNRRHYDYPAEDNPACILEHHIYRRDRVDRSGDGWRELLLAKDLVILEINEVHLHDRGWGFVRDALAQLRRGDAVRKGTMPVAQ